MNTINSNTEISSPLRRLVSDVGFSTPKTKQQKIDEPVQPLSVSDKHVLKQASLPRGPLFAICCVFFTEGFNYTLQFGFVKAFLINMGTPIIQAGYHAGILHAIFTISQLFSGLLYGTTTDQSEQKHLIVVTSLFCTMCINIVFGMCSSFYVAIFCRLVAGFMNGFIATAKIYITEVTDSSNSAYAYMLFGLSWGLGAFTAPHVGKWLAPSSLIPGYPYLLPWLFSAIFCISSMVICMLYMTPKEVLDGSAEDKGMIAAIMDLVSKWRGNETYHELSVIPVVHSDEI
jgi:MFS family permease